MIQELRGPAYSFAVLMAWRRLYYEPALRMLLHRGQFSTTNEKEVATSQPTLSMYVEQNWSVK